MSQSKIYKELLPLEIEKILKNTLGENARLKFYEKIPGGWFNTTYFVEASNPNKKMVLRVAPIRKELLVNYEKSMMKSEPIIYEMIAKSGVPTVDVIKFDDSYKIIDRDYILFDYIDSTTLNSTDFSQEIKSQINRELGGYIRKIHTIKSDNFGWINPDGTVKGSYSSWYDVLIELVDEMTQKISDNNLLPDLSIKKYSEFFREHKDVFHLKKSYPENKPCLIHNDLWSANILVSNNSGEWKIVGIIDADRALYGDREFEFALWGNNPDLLETYGIPLDMSFEGKLKRYGYEMILKSLNMYVSKKEFDDEEEYIKEKNVLLDLLGKI